VGSASFEGRPGLLMFGPVVDGICIMYEVESENDSFHLAVIIQLLTK
jgi:hypothetical protein